MQHLCHSQVERVVPALQVHLLCQQAVRLDHDQRVAGLHAEEEVVVVVIPAHKLALQPVWQRGPLSIASPETRLWASQVLGSALSQRCLCMQARQAAAVQASQDHKGRCDHGTTQAGVKVDGVLM